ncbi:hypothetical protein CUTA107171_15395 [Cupriavidus taiwanensis]
MPDAREQHIVLGQQRFPVRQRLRGQRARHAPAKFRRARQPPGAGMQRGIGKPVVEPQQRRQPHKHRVVEHAQVQRAIGRLEQPGRRVGGRQLGLGEHGVVHHQVGLQRGTGLQQRQPHMPAAAAARGLVQRRGCLLRRVQTGGQIDHEKGNAARLTAGIAVQVHQAAVGLHGGIDRGPVRQRPGMAVARDRDIDQRRVVRGQRLVADAHALGHTRAEVLDHHVGPLRQPDDGGAAVGAARIQHHALLARVAGDRDRGLAGADAPHLPRPVSARRLHLDHARPLLAQDQAAVRAGNALAQVEHGQAVEHGIAHGVVQGRLCFVHRYAPFRCPA